MLDLSTLPATVQNEFVQYSRLYTNILLGATGDEDARRIVRSYYDDLLWIMRVFKVSQKHEVYQTIFKLRRDAKYNGFTRRNSPNGIVQYYPDCNFIGGEVQ